MSIFFYNLRDKVPDKNWKRNKDYKPLKHRRKTDF